MFPTEEILTEVFMVFLRPLRIYRDRRKWTLTALGNMPSNLLSTNILSFNAAYIIHVPNASVDKLKNTSETYFEIE